jgi:hypothetical protein
MMGILTSTSRIDVVIGDSTKSFQKALAIINDFGGDIISVVMTAKEDGKRSYYFRLTSCKTEVIKDALEQEKFEVLEAMD